MAPPPQIKKCECTLHFKNTTLRCPFRATLRWKAILGHCDRAATHELVKWSLFRPAASPRSGPPAPATCRSTSCRRHFRCSQRLCQSLGPGVPEALSPTGAAATTVQEAAPSVALSWTKPTTMTASPSKEAGRRPATLAAVEPTMGQLPPAVAAAALQPAARPPLISCSCERASSCARSIGPESSSEDRKCHIRTAVRSSAPSCAL
mmetsp:Transcript_8406/g.21445  ORF Transcript_8406/g.21445 Transcript_8406/m.21445 type:complete len:206 (+) Transcript_8406:150-767(+)